MDKKILAVVLLSFISACSNPPSEYKVNIIEKISKNEFNDIVPMAGKETVAVKGDGGMYYMPLGQDKAGCTYYNSFSPGENTLTVVYYKKPDGAFTTLKNDADCMAGKKN